MVVSAVIVDQVTNMEGSDGSNAYGSTVVDDARPYCCFNKSVSYHKAAVVVDAERSGHLHGPQVYVSVPEQQDRTRSPPLGEASIVSGGRPFGEALIVIGAETFREAVAES